MLWLKQTIFAAAEKNGVHPVSIGFPYCINIHDDDYSSDAELRESKSDSDPPPGLMNAATPDTGETELLL